MISAVKEASLPSMPMASRAAAMGASSKDHVDFADVLGEAIASASSTIKSSESATLAGISGGIPMYKVVESVVAPVSLMVL